MKQSKRTACWKDFLSSKLLRQILAKNVSFQSHMLQERTYGGKCQYRFRIRQITCARNYVGFTLLISRNCQKFFVNQLTLSLNTFCITKKSKQIHIKISQTHSQTCHLRPSLARLHKGTIRKHRYHHLYLGVTKCI